jgi:AcrR family transcriptional regulator
VPEFETARQPRADAQRNRNCLFAAAMEQFTGSKDEVTLSAVAERAGVGIGTLYRHFPTRDALVEAIYRGTGLIQMNEFATTRDRKAE